MHFLADSSRESERKYRFNSALGLEIILYVGGTGIEINTIGPNLLRIHIWDSKMTTMSSTGFKIKKVNLKS